MDRVRGTVQIDWDNFKTDLWKAILEMRKQLAETRDLEGAFNATIFPFLKNAIRTTDGDHQIVKVMTRLMEENSDFNFTIPASALDGIAAAVVRDVCTEQPSWVDGVNRFDYDHFVKLIKDGFTELKRLLGIKDDEAALQKSGELVSIYADGLVGSTLFPARHLPGMVFRMEATVNDIDDIHLSQLILTAACVAVQRLQSGSYRQEEFQAVDDAVGEQQAWLRKNILQ